MRSVTRSEVKWLVNQAAVLDGELKQLDVELEHLVKRRAEVLKEQAACLRTLSVIAQADNHLVLPTVRAHRSYGGRGALRRFLFSALEQAAPSEMNTDELAFRAIAHFNLSFTSPNELYRFKHNTLGRALRTLASDGLIEAMGITSTGRYGYCNWRQKLEHRTLAELALQANGLNEEAEG